MTRREGERSTLHAVRRGTEKGLFSSFFFFGFFPFSSSVIKKGGDDWGVAFLLMRRPLQHYTYMETRKLETHKIRLYLANSISDFSGRGLSEVVVGLAWFGLYLLSWPGGFNYKGSG